MKRLITPLVLGAALASVGTAVAASGYSAGVYSGHTSQKAHGTNLTITFRIVKPIGGSPYVTNFTYKTIDTCTQIKPVTVTHTQTGKISISSSGRFVDSHDYGNKTYHGKHNHLKLVGRVSGNQVTGSIADDNIAPPPPCHARVTFSANLK
jgi:hypothetical protein